MKSDEREKTQLREAFRAYCGERRPTEAFECTKLLWEKHKDRESVLTYRELIRRSSKLTDQLLELYRQSYDLCARDVFDDFMLAMEWNRPPQEQFWLPRRKKLIGVCDSLQDLEDGRLEELFLSMPPRVGKSTLVQFFALWVMLKRPSISNLYATYTESVAKVFYTGLLEILNDPWTYRWNEIFPDRKVASTDAKELLININSRSKYASFTGKSLYGSLNGGTNADGYLMADDLHSGIEEALNPELLKTAWFRVENNFLTRNANGKAKNLWIGTRWSLSDCIARRIDLLENEPKYANRKYRIFNVPALNEKDESNFEYSFGLGFNTEYFQRVRASFERNNDLASFSAQYQGEPVERNGTVFLPEDLQYYNGILPEGEDPDRIFVVVDPAWGGGDYVAAVCLYQYGEQLFVHDLVYDNGDKRITQPMVAKLAINNNASAMYVEGTKTTKSYATDVNELLHEYGFRLNMITGTKHWTGTGKAQRIFDRAPDIREKMIFRDSGNRDKAYQKFMENVFSFQIEGKNKHDDAPDVLAQAITRAILGESRAKICKRPF